MNFLKIKTISILICLIYLKNMRIKKNSLEPESEPKLNTDLSQIFF